MFASRRNDTPESLMERWRLGLESLSPEERVEMACSMFEFSRKIVEETIRSEVNGISEGELRQKVFLRFYGSDFDKPTQDKILQHLNKPGYFPA